MRQVRDQLRPPGPPGGNAGLRRCDAPGCAGHGEFRAPRARDRLNDYYWFCLDHVRAYNAQWNFYAGMSETEVERQIRADTTWQRPTWPLGARGGRPRGEPDIDWRAFGAEEWETVRQQRASKEEAARRPRPGSAEEDALAVFDMVEPITRDTIKARYKTLVKLHHPDANGGSKDAEERLKIINRAYSTLMASPLAS
jgi:DnaJ-domain-containing protein 1